MAAWFDELDLIAQLRVCAHVLGGTAKTFRALDRGVMADQLREIGSWCHDLAHDLEQLTEDQ